MGDVDVYLPVCVERHFRHLQRRGMSKAEETNKMNDMTYDEIVDYLYNIPRFTKGGHMDNVRKLLAALSNPQDSFKYVHVAGTNGKGSVCAYLERCLRLCHQKTGLFTSPHLIRVNERMRICGREISDTDFVRIFHEIRGLVEEQAAHGCVEPTFFEYIYLMAMVYFREQRIDYGVIETGMGGRMDFTNACSHPVLTVITPISMDHMAVLGDTIDEIADEKAGIIKAGCPLVYYGQDPQVKAIVTSYVQSLGVDACCLTDAQVEIVADDGKTIDFSLNYGYHDNYRLTLNTAATYQAVNASLALLGFKALWPAVAGVVQAADAGSDEQPGVSGGDGAAKAAGAECGACSQVAGAASGDLFLSVVRRAFASTHWPGRMEALGERFYVDGAHNEAGIDAFVETIRCGFGHKPLVVVFAVAGDKDYRAMVRKICSIPELIGVVVTEIENGRRCDLHEVAAEFEKNWNGIICSTYNIREALDRGLALKGQSGILCCVGSLYLVGSVKEITGGISDDQL